MPDAGASDVGEDRPELAGPPSGRSICVYLGGNLGREQRYIGLVYGGASVGLMGVVANAVLEGGGFVIGVVPGNCRIRNSRTRASASSSKSPRCTSANILCSSCRRAASLCPAGSARWKRSSKPCAGRSSRWSCTRSRAASPTSTATTTTLRPPVRLPRSCDRRGVAAAAAEPRARPAGPDRHGSATDDSDGVGRRRTGHA